MLAYLRPDSDGVLNVWCRTVGKSDDRVVTQDKYRGIRQAFWAEDSTTLLYMQDDAGDENFHLFAIDATSPSSVARDLTPYKVRVRVRVRVRARARVRARVRVGVQVGLRSWQLTHEDGGGLEI